MLVSSPPTGARQYGRREVLAGLLLDLADMILNGPAFIEDTYAILVSAVGISFHHDQAVVKRGGGSLHSQSGQQFVSPPVPRERLSEQESVF